MQVHKSYFIEKTPSKNIIFKLLHPETDQVIYQIKERKKGITSSKTQFFISGADHKQYISSIYPLDFEKEFTGKFELQPNCSYTIEYKALRYTLLFDYDTCTILGGVR